MIEKISLYLNSLEKRERLILLTGIYISILIIGIFFITFPMIEKVKKLDKRINNEIKNYRELMKITSEYLLYKSAKIPVSLSIIEKIAEDSGIKDKISSLKPSGNNSIELFMEQVEGQKLSYFLQNLKRKNLKIISFSMNDPKGNEKYDVRMTISGE